MGEPAPALSCGAGARILAVADAYDAITSERPYRKAMDPRIAFNIIDGCKGSQFDPEIINAFFKNQEESIFTASYHCADKL